MPTLRLGTFGSHVHNLRGAKKAKRDSLDGGPRRLLVNNLFQLTDGSWQANLRANGDEDEAMRRKTSLYDFGRGPDPRRALIEALKKAYDRNA